MTTAELLAEMASQLPIAGLGSEIHDALKESLAASKAVGFGQQWVLDTALPPYPSRAFGQFAQNMVMAQEGRPRLFSVCLAVTNRCVFGCGHCYNAGRSQEDMPLGRLKGLARELQDLGAASVALTGGEPLLRNDLEEICRAFDDRTSLVVSTTGLGLTAARACTLKDAGVFALSVSLDSDQEAEHDRLRAKPGAFHAALDAVEAVRKAGLYPYIMTMVRHDMLDRERFFGLLELAGRAGAMEVRILPPVAVGRLAGRNVGLSSRERQRIQDYVNEANRRDDLPAVSNLSCLGRLLGCQAGLGHIYIDGSGELCPCNYVPLSFGNVADEPVGTILDRMGPYFPRPRTVCTARWLAKRIPPGPLPKSPQESAAISNAHLPRFHGLPLLYLLCGGGRNQPVQTDHPGTYISEPARKDATLCNGCEGPANCPAHFLGV